MPPSLIGMPLLETLALAAELAPQGCFVEIGVYKGGSAGVLYEIAQRHGRALYLYDTFRGIPFADPVDSHAVGSFSDCDVEEVRKAMPKAHVVQGVFPASIVPMPPIAMAHIDADQYRSTLDACRTLSPLMVKGGYMLFDDYRGVNGCIKAVNECFAEIRVLPDGRALVRFP